MSHEPPIPAGNQSPFPLQEPKHHAGGPPPGAEIARTPKHAPATHTIGKVAIGGIVAVGVAALAAVGAVVYAARPSDKRGGKKGRKK